MNSVLLSVFDRYHSTLSPSEIYLRLINGFVMRKLNEKHLTRKIEILHIRKQIKLRQTELRLTQKVKIGKVCEPKS